MFTRKVLFVVFFIIPQFCFAEIYYNFGTGVGLGNVLGDISFFPRFCMNVKSNSFILQARVLNVEEPTTNKLPIQHYLEAGILPGISFEIDEKINLNLHGGLSFIYCVEREKVYRDQLLYDYKPNTYRTIGVPLGLELLFLPLDKFGLGLSINSNFNQPNSFLGGAFSIYYGKFRM